MCLDIQDDVAGVFSLKNLVSIRRRERLCAKRVTSTLSTGSVQRQELNQRA